MSIKIIATVGPSSFDENTISLMDKAGVDIFRINLSHTELNDLPDKISCLKKWTTKPIGIDTEGAQIRTLKLQDSNMNIINGSLVRLVNAATNIPPGSIPVEQSLFESDIQKGTIIRIDFNAVILQVLEVSNDIILTKAINGGIVGNNKGIAIDPEIRLDPFTKKDLEAFRIISKFGLQNIFFSFCSNSESVKQLRHFFDYKLEVVGKIENISGLTNLGTILPECDSVLIDRGDLSREVAIEKIPLAQKYIINTAKKFHKPVYVATNLMESMLHNIFPTRAEIHDIIQTIDDGAQGLVLAAETAIGKNPVNCVRILNKIIGEVKNVHLRQDMPYLLSLPEAGITPPHGGKLIEQNYKTTELPALESLPVMEVSSEIFSDCIQIAIGTYSPVTGFFNKSELNSVLSKYQLQSGTTWTLPIIFQIPNLESIPKSDWITLKNRDNGSQCVYKIEKIEELKNMTTIAKKWFGTDDSKHPGVNKFLNSGNYIVSGRPYLFSQNYQSNGYDLAPRQIRKILNDLNWTNMVGFHTRNIPHLGHEFIQKKALKQINADAIFISPITGIKKKGDFSTHTVIQAYETLIGIGVYEPFKAIICSFNTYARYSGPREAVFTAICRKNFGCNYFIVGRDHTGVGDYYPTDASIKLIESLDLGINVITFDKVYYCKKCGVTDNCNHSDGDKINISGNIVRDRLKNGLEIPEYLLRREISSLVRDLITQNPETVFV
ncbi:MAG: sulfate adenylyltransferase [Ignavibacteria bacterium]|nr:sulfate adenylyltransferase [Ignavibacteria bacterium]